MPKSYSGDLRERVIEAVELEGSSRREAAERFDISASSAVRWMQRVSRRERVRTAGMSASIPSVVGCWRYAASSLYQCLRGLPTRKVLQETVPGTVRRVTPEVKVIFSAGRIARAFSASSSLTCFR
jgi:transposase-like protein